MTACLACGFDAHAVVSATYGMHIDRDVLSGNLRIVNASTARWAYAKHRDAWCSEIRAQRNAYAIPAATGKRRVTLTRHYNGRQRAFDRDNLAAGLKGCVDALVREGVLLNDDEQSAEIHYKQQRSERRGLGVLVEVLA